MRVIQVLGAVAALALVAGSAAPVLADDGDDARAATRRLVRDAAADLGVVIGRAEQSCLTRKFVAGPQLASAVLGARDFDKLPLSKRVRLVRIVLGCAPNASAAAFLKNLGNENVTLTPKQARCLVDGWAILDRSAIAGIVSGKVTDLEPSTLEQILRPFYACVPTALGHAVVTGFLSSMGDTSDVQVSDEQSQCAGEGVAASPQLMATFVQGREPDPAAATEVMLVIGRCAPDLLAATITRIWTEAGVPPDLASCAASRVAQDPALIESMGAAFQSGAATLPPALVEVLAACRA